MIEKQKEHSHLKLLNNEVIVSLETLKKDQWIGAEQSELIEDKIYLNKYEK